MPRASPRRVPRGGGRPRAGPRPKLRRAALASCARHESGLDVTRATCSVACGLLSACLHIKRSITAYSVNRNYHGFSILCLRTSHTSVRLITISQVSLLRGLPNEALACRLLLPEALPVDLLAGKYIYIYIYIYIYMLSPPQNPPFQCSYLSRVQPIHAFVDVILLHSCSGVLVKTYESAATVSMEILGVTLGRNDTVFVTGPHVTCTLVLNPW